MKTNLMERIKSTAMAVLLLAGCLLSSTPAEAQTPTAQLEKLDRGLVALPRSSGTGNFVSWRLLSTDNEDETTFDVIRNNTVVKTDLYTTNYEDTGGNKNATYRIVTKVNGEAIDTTEAVAPWQQVYLPLKLNRPDNGTQGGTYSPNDMSVGDVDGDGQYELFVKWDPSTSKDNSQSGKTDKVYIDCYRLDGTQLWRIDLGVNIRAGAHYTQFQVYDYDGDGCAELMCKTAPGTKDGVGTYVNQVATDSKIKAASNTKDWRNSNGRIDGGHEYLTVFNGLTGAAIHTVAYYPNRNAKAELTEAAGTFNWDDRSGKSDYTSYGNRGERYLAATAFLGGPGCAPSAIFCRGYYTYAYVWAVDFDGQHLSTRWLHLSGSKTKYEVMDAQGNTTSYSAPAPTGRSSSSRTMYGNGNHNMSVADVDGDGCDEIVWGSAALDHDGRLLYATGFGHGDAIHLADHCPDRPGLELFQIHEESPFGWDLHDAATGQVLYSATGDDDNGRGIAGQFDANVRGSLFWSANDGQARSAATGKVVSASHGSSNYRIFWDADLQEELFDGGKIDKWNGNGTTRIYLNGKNIYDYNSSSTCNGTKSTPCLQADILGDWREELILWSSADNCTLNIFTTNTTTKYRMPTLMHDHTYRMGVCWQNTAYNQPPHLGYYLPDAMLPRLIAEERIVTGVVGQEMVFESKGRYMSLASFVSTTMPDGTVMKYKLPDGFEKNTLNKSLLIKGVPQEEGDYRFAVTLKGLGNESVADTVTFHVVSAEGINSIAAAKQEGQVRVYDAAGHFVGNSTECLPRGIYIVRRELPTGVVTRKLVIESKKIM